MNLIDHKISSMNEQQLRSWLSGSADVVVHAFHYGHPSSHSTFLLFYCAGMANTDKIDMWVMPELISLVNSLEQISSEALNFKKTFQIEAIDSGPKETEIVIDRLYSGELLVLFEQVDLLYSINIAHPPNRQPEESTAEVSIKGPRDGFTEDITTNIALIRKRLKTHTLHCEKFIVGQRSRTSVALMYLEDVVSHELLKEARSRISGIDIDGLIGMGQLEEVLSDSAYSLFPLLDHIGRPDYVSESLLRGRFAILVNGLPMAVIAPANMLMLLKSPEDSHFPFHYVSFERLLRMIGLISALLLPGFWVAVSGYSFEQIPFPLLATIVNSKLGIPLSSPMDFIIMLSLFELFREAGMRLPKAVGQTVAVVGGLIVGDAAIRAGITAPVTVVVVAISTICMFSIVNQSLAGTITVLRFLLVILSSLLGMFGFIIGVIGLFLYMSTLGTFGVSYVTVFSPSSWADFKSTVKRMYIPWTKMKKRPSFLNTQDKSRERGDTSE